MRKKFITLSVIGATLLGSVAAFIYCSENTLTTKADNRCIDGHHIGNHYSAKDPTCVDAGNKEFWACCECHEQFLEEPIESVWTDCGEYLDTLLDTHIAYVTPTGVHNYQYQVVDSLNTEGNIDIVKACEMCGELLDDTVYGTRPKLALQAEFTVNVNESEEYPWLCTKTDQYVSFGGLPDSEASIMSITITSPGELYVQCKASSQVASDNLIVESEYGKRNIVYGLSGTQARMVLLDVEVGQKINFRYQKDSSGSANNDKATIIFKTPTSYNYHVIEYDSCGGSDVAPGFIVNSSVTKLLPTPTRNGYTFNGWWTNPDEGKGTYVRDLATGTANRTYYAHWSAN